MRSGKVTAISTAIEETALSSKTHLFAENADKTRFRLEPAVAKPTSQERGVWLEHGKWAASAGFDPISKERIRAQGFLTCEEAQEWRAKQFAKKASDKADRRRKVRELAMEESVDAAEALDLLAAAGLAKTGILRTAAQEFIARHPEATPTTVQELHVEWLNNKRDLNRRKDTLRSAKNSFASFLKKFGALALTEIKYSHVREVVFDPNLPNPTTRRGRGVVITNFFNYAQKQGKIGPEARDHPCFALELPSKPEMEPEPWPVADFEKLLSFSWKNEDRYHATAFVALAGLCGVRTEELARLRFGPDGIDIDRALIRISPDKAKKRRARILDMGPELQGLLKALRDRPRARLKHVRPLPRPTDPGSRVFSRKLMGEFRAVLKDTVKSGGAGLPIVSKGGQTHISKKGKVTITQPSAWRENGLRASFATYHFERHGDAKLTAALMGHTGDLGVFFHHYRALADKGDGTKFFAVAASVLAQAADASAG